MSAKNAPSLPDGAAYILAFNAVTRAVTKIAPDLLIEATYIVGAALVAAGAHMVYRPAGYIVGGLLLMLAAWLIAKGRSLPGPDA